MFDYFRIYNEHTNVSPYVVDDEREYVLQDCMVRHLWCMIPDYKSGGNVTKCYYADSTDELVHRPMLRLFYDLAKYLVVDLRALHNTMGQRALYNQPRTLAVNMTWIPFKTRKPVGKDGTYGYFNIVVPFTYPMGLQNSNAIFMVVTRNQSCYYIHRPMCEEN